MARHLLLAIVFWTVTLYASAAERTTTDTNVPIEITFHASSTHGDPFSDVTVDVDFTDPHGVQRRVPAFWDGGSTWKVRYASGVLGAHSFRSVCSDAGDSGLNGVRGVVTISPYRGSNPLFKRGPIRIAEDKRHFVYADGTPFFWFGDTWWMGLAKRLRWPDEFQALTEDRVRKGFNIVQIVAGLYPDMPPFDRRGANEAGFPWEPNYARINPAYFDRAYERLQYLVNKGITPCIVGSWGYFMTWMTVDQLEKHWRNLIARYGAMPVVWCGCGEVDMPWYLANRGEYNRQDRMRKWTEVVRYIRRTDPFHRPLTLHPDGYSARDTINDPALLDFDMLQTGHGLAGAARGAAQATAATYAASPKMPFIDGESSYENLNNEIPAAWTRATFWISMLNGAAGHTYGANGIWQNNRPGDPHGKSPSGNNWGTLPSRDAMHLPGSTQESLGKRLFEKYPWQSFSPHPEWASYLDNGWTTLAASRWIWFPGGNPAIDAPVGVRYFRRSFVLPMNQKVKEARLLMSADNTAIAFLNGNKVGTSSDWGTGAKLDGLASRLVNGRNVLAIQAENVAADVRQNPAGLIAVLEVRFEDGTTQIIRSSRDWKTSETGPSGWNAIDFDDHNWHEAMDIGAFGEPPWGSVAMAGFQVRPQAAGVNGGVRILYMLEPNPVVIHALAPGARYTATLFDPVSGQSRRLKAASADPTGDWICYPPIGWNHDRVLVLEPIPPKLRQEGRNR